MAAPRTNSPPPPPAPPAEPGADAETGGTPTVPPPPVVPPPPPAPAPRPAAEPMQPPRPGSRARSPLASAITAELTEIGGAVQEADNLVELKAAIGRLVELLRQTH